MSRQGRKIRRRLTIPTWLRVFVLLLLAAAVMVVSYLAFAGFGQNSHEGFPVISMVPGLT